MQLQDLENYVLWNTQQSEMVNFGGQPNWAAATNPNLQKSAVDFIINRAYMRVSTDLADDELLLYRYVFPSIAQTSAYPLPPFPQSTKSVMGRSFMGSVLLGGSAPLAPLVWDKPPPWGTAVWGPIPVPPNVQRVVRVLYGPLGMTWVREYEGGERLVGQAEFRRRTGFGYLRPFTFGTYPDFVSISSDRKLLLCFPGSASPNDTIGVEYVPKVTPNSDVPILIQPTDSPLLPEETHDLMVIWATRLCWVKLREAAMAQEYEVLYNGGPALRGLGGELANIRETLRMRSTGDNLCFRDANDSMAMSSLIAGVLVP